MSAATDNGVSRLDASLSPVPADGGGDNAAPSIARAPSDEMRQKNPQTDNSIKVQSRKTVSLKHGARGAVFVNGTIWVASRDGSIYVRDGTTGDEIKKIQAQDVATRTTSSFFVNAMILHANKVWTASTDGKIRVYDPMGDRLLQFHAEHMASVKCLAGTSDQRVIWTGAEDWLILLRDARDGRVLKQLGGHNNWIRSMTVVELSPLPGSAAPSPSKPFILAHHRSSVSESSVRRSISGLSTDGPLIPSDTNESDPRRSPVDASAVSTSSVNSFLSAIPNSQNIFLWSASDDGIRVWDILGVCVDVLTGHGSSDRQSTPPVAAGPLPSGPPGLNRSISSDTDLSAAQDDEEAGTTDDDQASVRSRSPGPDAIAERTQSSPINVPPRSSPTEFAPPPQLQQSRSPSPFSGLARSQTGIKPIVGRPKHRNSLLTVPSGAGGDSSADSADVPRRSSVSNVESGEAAAKLRQPLPTMFVPISGSPQQSTPSPRSVASTSVTGTAMTTVLSICAFNDKVWSGGADGRICIWDARTRQLLLKWQAAEKGIICIRVVGPEIWTTCAGGTIRRWQPDTGTPIGSLRVESGVVTDIVWDRHSLWVTTINPGRLQMFKLIGDSALLNVSRRSRSQSILAKLSSSRTLHPSDRGRSIDTLDPSATTALAASSLEATDAQGFPIPRGRMRSFTDAGTLPLSHSRRSLASQSLGDDGFPSDLAADPDGPLTPSQGQSRGTLTPSRKRGSVSDAVAASQSLSSAILASLSSSEIRASPSASRFATLTRSDSRRVLDDINIRSSEPQAGMPVVTSSASRGLGMKSMPKKAPQATRYSSQTLRPNGPSPNIPNLSPSANSGPRARKKLPAYSSVTMPRPLFRSPSKSSMDPSSPAPPSHERGPSESSLAQSITGMPSFWSDAGTQTDDSDFGAAVSAARRLSMPSGPTSIHRDDATDPSSGSGTFHSAQMHSAGLDSAARKEFSVEVSERASPSTAMAMSAQGFEVEGHSRPVGIQRGTAQWTRLPTQSSGVEQSPLHTPIEVLIHGPEAAQGEMMLPRSSSPSIAAGSEYSTGSGQIAVFRKRLMEKLQTQAAADQSHSDTDDMSGDATAALLEEFDLIVRHLQTGNDVIQTAPLSARSFLAQSASELTVVNHLGSSDTVTDLRPAHAAAAADRPLVNSHSRHPTHASTASSSFFVTDPIQLVINVTASEPAPAAEPFDPTPLHAEIVKLRAENERLRLALTQATAASASAATVSSSISSIATSEPSTPPSQSPNTLISSPLLADGSSPLRGSPSVLRGRGRGRMRVKRVSLGRDFFQAIGGNPSEAEIEALIAREEAASNPDTPQLALPGLGRSHNQSPIEPVPEAAPTAESEESGPSSVSATRLTVTNSVASSPSLEHPADGTADSRGPASAVAGGSVAAAALSASLITVAGAHGTADSTVQSSNVTSSASRSSGAADETCLVATHVVPTHAGSLSSVDSSSSPSSSSSEPSSISSGSSSTVLPSVPPSPSTSTDASQATKLQVNSLSTPSPSADAIVFTSTESTTGAVPARAHSPNSFQTQDTSSATGSVAAASVTAYGAEELRSHRSDPSSSTHADVSTLHAAAYASSAHELVQLTIVPVIVQITVVPEAGPSASNDFARLSSLPDSSSITAVSALSSALLASAAGMSQPLPGSSSVLVMSAGTGSTLVDVSSRDTSSRPSDNPNGGDQLSLSTTVVPVSSSSAFFDNSVTNISSTPHPDLPPIVESPVAAGASVIAATSPRLSASVSSSFAGPSPLTRMLSGRDRPIPPPTPGRVAREQAAVNLSNARAMNDAFGFAADVFANDMDPNLLARLQKVYMLCKKQWTLGVNLVISSASEVSRAGLVESCKPLRLPRWEPDNSSDRCSVCLDTFWLLGRRHHCRLCGALLCSDCCSKKLGAQEFVLIPSKDQKRYRQSRLASMSNTEQKIEWESIEPSDVSSRTIRCCDSCALVVEMVRLREGDQFKFRFHRGRVASAAGFSDISS